MWIQKAINSEIQKEHVRFSLAFYSSVCAVVFLFSAKPFEHSASSEGVCCNVSEHSCSPNTCIQLNEMQGSWQFTRLDHMFNKTLIEYRSGFQISAFQLIEWSVRSKFQLDTRIQSSSSNVRLFIYITKFTHFQQDCIAANYYRFDVDFRRIPFIHLLIRIIFTKSNQYNLSSNKTKFCIKWND